MSNFKISQARVRQIVEDKPVISQNIYDIGSIVKIENSIDDIDLPILTIDNRPGQDDGFIHLKTTRLYLNPYDLTIRANASGNKTPIFVGNLSGKADVSKYTERIQVPAISKQETDQTIKYEIVFRRDARDDVGAVGVQLSSDIYIGKDLTSIYAKRFHGIADKADKIKADYAQKSSNDAKYEIVVKKSEPDTEGYIDVQLLSKIYVNQDLDSIYATNFHGKADEAKRADNTPEAEHAVNADNAKEAEHAKKADKVTIENQNLGVHYYPLFVHDSNNNDSIVDGTDIKTSFSVRLPAVGDSGAWHYLDVQDKYTYGTWKTKTAEEDTIRYDYSSSRWVLVGNDEQTKGYFSEMIIYIDYFIDEEYKQIRWSYLLPKTFTDDDNITSLNSDLRTNDFWIDGIVKNGEEINKSIKITKKNINITKWREKIMFHRVGSIDPPEGSNIKTLNGWFEYDG